MRIFWSHFLVVCVACFLFLLSLGLSASSNTQHHHHRSSHHQHLRLDHSWVPSNADSEVALSELHRYQDLLKALHFIQKVQNPPNCTVFNSKLSKHGKFYVKMSMGIGGGFAAQFQYGAAEFMRLLHASNFEYPIVVVGKLQGYSSSERCKNSNYEWLCFFLEPSSCQKELLSTGTEVSYGIPNISDEEVIPEPFKSVGLPFWWGAVQYYLFQIKPFVLEHIHLESSHMSGGKGFPFYLPVAGMHVRHGDKHTDGFLEHSLHEELQYIRQSRECMVLNNHSDCFSYLNLSNPSVSLLWLTKAAKGYSSMIRIEDIDQYNSSKGWWHPDNMQLAVDSKTIHSLINKLHLATLHHHESSFRHQENGTITINSTIRSNHANHMGIIPSLNNFVFPLQVFVASDDPSVVATADRLGFLTDSAGISQHTSTAGMWNTLVSHPELGFNATLEIITDIYYLSHSSTLLGICASQVFRMAVALSNVTGILQYVKVMDMNQMGRVKQLSNKYRVPFPEHFE